MNSEFADFPLISADHPDRVCDALRRTGVIRPEDTVTALARAGDGNMNCVLRAQLSDGRSVIVKQARPWVEKYPQIEAPVERALSELSFCRAVADCPDVVRRMPELLADLPNEYLLVYSDLGPVSDFSDGYVSGAWHSFPLNELFDWLISLHNIPLSAEQRLHLENRRLRELNHQHIFVIPFTDPPAISLDDVCEGLTELTRDIRCSDAVRTQAAELGELYLSDSNELLHGDFYPGSWVRGKNGVCVIDPEFCFPGRAEFDVAVLAAHCVLAGAEDSIADTTVREYQSRGGRRLDRPLVSAFAGVEIIRRIAGVAQLPQATALSERARCLSAAGRLLA